MTKRRSSLRAVCAGFLADILTSQMLMFVLTLVLGAKMFGAAPQTASPQRMTQMLGQLQSSVSFLLPATALGLLGSIIGGYVAAALSEREDAWKNAAIAGSISLLTSVLAVLEPSKVPLWISGLGLALSLPATMLGAFLCVSARRDEEAATDSGESKNRHDEK